MKYQIKYKILAAAYKQIKRSSDRNDPNQRANPFSHFDAGVMSHLMAFIDKKQTGIFLGSSFLVYEIVMAGKKVTNGTYFPEKLPFGDLKLREDVGSLAYSIQLVTEKGVWESDAIINYIKSSDNEKKNMLIKEAFEYAVRTGHVDLLNDLKKVFKLTAGDARADDNKALRSAAEKGHANVLRVLKEVFELTADDARDDENYFLRHAAKNGHVEVLRFLKDEWGLTADDARACDNAALKYAAEKGHVEVLRFLKDEWELTADDARAGDNDALRLAAYNGHVEALKVLIEYYEVPLTQEIHDKLISKAYAGVHLEVIDYLNTVTIPPHGKRQKTNVQTQQK